MNVKFSGFNPEMLTTARHSRGLTQKALALKSGLPQATISRYESGSLPPSEGHIKTLSSTLEYPKRFFHRETRVLNGPGADALFHRKRRSVPVITLSKAYACAAIRRMEIWQLTQGYPIEQALPWYPIEEYENPAKIARTVRALWKMPPGPVFNITRQVEAEGCVILSHNFGNNAIDGFSVRHPAITSFIHINSEMPPDRWRWTVAHELGHLIMHSDPARPSDDTEKEANEFAGEFLTPGHEIINAMAGLNLTRLAGLKLEWKISMQALIMQADRLKSITPQQKKSLFIQINKAGYRNREPEHLSPMPEPPILPYKMAKHHMTTLEYGRKELLEYLCIGEKDFQYHYSDPEDFIP